MKKTILLLFLILFSINNAQEIKFEEVVQADSISAKNLYNNAILWVANQYRSANDVIQVKDSENFTIVGKGSYVYEPDFYMANIPARGYIRHTFKITCKDGRYKVELYDFNHVGTINRYGDDGSIGILNDGKKYLGTSKALDKGFRNRVNLDAVKQSKKYAEATIQSLKTAMTKPNPSQDNW